MIEAKKLTKIYDDGVTGLDNLNLTVEKGEIFCLLGSNGAGKSTAINLIFNFIEPTSGAALVDGIDAAKEPLRAKSRLAYVSENVFLYEYFSALKNLRYFSRIGGRRDLSDDDLRAVLNDVGLPPDAANRRVGTFSKGMRQKTGLAIAIAKDAPAVIMDEPTSGLDPEAADNFLEIMKELRARGKAILFSSHDILRAQMVSDRLGIMLAGRVIALLERDHFTDSNISEIYRNAVRGNGPSEGGAVDAP